MEKSIKNLTAEKQRIEKELAEHDMEPGATVQMAYSLKAVNDALEILEGNDPVKSPKAKKAAVKKDDGE